MNRRRFAAGSACVITLAAGSKALSQAANSNEVAAITAAIHAYQAAWNASDLTGMGALYTADIHWVNVRAMHWRGFAEVDRAHRIYFDLMFRGVQQELLEIESITPIAPGVAVAVVLWRLGAYKAPNGDALPAGRTRMSLVYVKSAGAWKIAHGHNEDVNEAAQPFDPIRGSVLSPG